MNPQEGLCLHPVMNAGDDEAEPGPGVAISLPMKFPFFCGSTYRDHWFWIDDDDLLTKRALTAVMFFFTLAESGSSDKLPLITIPAQ